MLGLYIDMLGELVGENGERQMGDTMGTRKTRGEGSLRGGEDACGLLY